PPGRGGALALRCGPEAHRRAARRAASVARPRGGPGRIRLRPYCSAAEPRRARAPGGRPARSPHAGPRAGGACRGNHSPVDRGRAADDRPARTLQPRRTGQAAGAGRAGRCRGGARTALVGGSRRGARATYCRAGRRGQGSRPVRTAAGAATGRARAAAARARQAPRAPVGWLAPLPRRRCPASTRLARAAPVAQAGAFGGGAAIYPTALVAARIERTGRERAATPLGPKTEAPALPQRALATDGPWLLGPGAGAGATRIARHLRTVCPTLGDRWTPQLGVKTGADDVFLVAHPGPVTRPIVRGRDLGPWR